MDAEVTLDYVTSEETLSYYNEDKADRTLYKVEDKLSPVLSFLNALQILVSQVLSVVWLPLLLTEALCLLSGDAIKVYLVSTALLTAGVITSLQSILGIRLPTVAAPSVLYTSSIVSLLQGPSLKCPSSGDLYAMGPDLRALEWQARLREVQGALLFAGVSQALLGFSGVQACLCRALSPNTVAPAIILAGLTAAREPLSFLHHTNCTNWLLFFITVMSMVVFTLCLRDVNLPLPMLSLRSGLTARWFPVLRMFPVLWTCVAAYVIHKAVTTFQAPQSAPYPDIQPIAFEEAVDNSKWFFFPFPYEWGLPTLSWPTVLHMLPAILLQSLTSLLLFYATADACGVGKPPRRALSRGWAAEGLGLMFGSCWGQAVTTNPTNIGLMFFTGVVNRSSTHVAALLMIAISHFTRLTAILVNIPTEFLSAIQLCFNAGLVAIGISSLKLINFSSVREISIVGFSLFLGLTVPQSTAGTAPTGQAGLDHFLSLSLASPVCVGAVTGYLLDLFLPGRIKSKKSQKWRYRSEEDKRTYRLPTWEELLCSVLERIPCFVTN